MARISDEQIMEIRNSVNIVDVIAEYVPLIQKGKNYFGVCPFHDDHNPSMSVSPGRQIYTCFVCGATGNVFTFLMEYEHITFMEAVKRIADKVNISIDVGPFTKKKDSSLDELYEMYELTDKFYQNNLKTASGSNALKYLHSRGIEQEIIKEFGIGISFVGDKVYKLLKASNIDDKVIENSGLCNRNDKGYYDLFSNRIMFPLWNIDGKTVGFSGRIYNSEDTSKYVNSKESAIFKKGQLLYNFHRVKEHVRRTGQVIVVEGFMDVIALYKVGIKNVVATMGTAITSEQAHLLKKLSSNIILLFDGDKAGNKATIACSEELSKIGVIPKIIRLEDNLDPDEYLNRHGIDKLNEHIDNPISLLDYKMIILKDGKNLNNSDDISNYINEVIKELHLVKDNIIREIALKKLSKETGVAVETLSSLMMKEEKKNVEISRPVIKEVGLKNRYQQAYENLLFYMLYHKEIIRLFDESDVFIPERNYRYLACEIVFYYKQYERFDIADFISYLEDKQELKETLNKIMLLSLPPYTRDVIDDYIKVLNDYTIELEVKRLEGLLDKTSSEIDKASIANQIMEIKKGVSANAN